MLIERVLSRTVVLLVICGLLASGALAQMNQPNNRSRRSVTSRSALSPAFKKAGADAYEDLQRVPLLMAKAADADLQRFDAEMALANAWRSQSNNADRQAYQVLDASWRMGELARDAFARNDYTGLKTYMHAHDVCFVEATLIFDPAALDDGEDEARAAPKHCIVLSQQILAGISSR